MTDKEKTIKELKEALDGLGITNKYRLNIIRAIEYLQEEPVSEEWTEELTTKLDSMSKEDFKKVFDKYAVDFNEEPVSEDLEKIIEEIAEPTILNAYGTKELARRLRNTICGTSESEDLEEVAKIYTLDDSIKPWRNLTKEAFIAGAKWQEKKDQDDVEIAREEIYNWLANHYRDYMHNPTRKKLEAFFGMDMITDLKEAMGDE